MQAASQYLGAEWILWLWNEAIIMKECYSSRLPWKWILSTLLSVLKISMQKNNMSYYRLSWFICFVFLDNKHKFSVSYKLSNIQSIFCYTWDPLTSPVDVSQEITTKLRLVKVPQVSKAVHIFHSWHNPCISHVTDNTPYTQGLLVVAT